MKICYVLNSPLPTTKAHGLQVASMCEAFVVDNIDCELIVPYRRADPTIEETDIARFYGLKKEFPITKLRSLDLIYWQWIPIIGKIFFWLQQISFGLSVRRYLASQPDSVVYSRDPFVLYLLRNTKSPLFFEAHHFPSNAGGLLYRTILSRINGLIVITQKLADRFSAYYNGPILVAHDAVDVEKFDIGISKEEARRRLSLPLDKKLAVYVGHIYGWKGARTLLECVNYLDSETKLVIVGGTEDDITRAREFVSAEHLKRITIIPHVPHHQVPEYLKAADVLLLTGNNEDPRALYYTSPMKMFEYMASGRPIVAQDLPSFREILNEQCAIIVSSEDAQKLTDGIKLVLSDQAVGDMIAHNAFEKVKSLTWESRARAIYGYIQEVK